MMNLQKKLNFGFILLPLLLVVAGGWSWLRFHNLSRGVEAILQENYLSIHSATDMADALERMDSSALLYLNGDREAARLILNRADSLYDSALAEAEKNITLPGEMEIFRRVEQNGSSFRKVVTKLFSSASIDLYRREVQPSFLAAKQSLNDLRQANSQAMYNMALQVSREAKRAGLPATILIFAGVLFTLMFAWLTRIYVVGPLRQLVERVQIWRNTGQFHPPDVETGDEIEMLVTELRDISLRVKPAKQP